MGEARTLLLPRESSSKGTLVEFFLVPFQSQVSKVSVPVRGDTISLVT